MMKNDEKSLVKIAFLAGARKDFEWLEKQLEKYQSLDAADLLENELCKRPGAEDCQNRSE